MREKINFTETIQQEIDIINSLEMVIINQEQISYLLFKVKKDFKK